MKTEIIAVGTEILMGYVINTNVRDISQELLDIGLGTFYQSVVGDNSERIKEALDIASSRSDIIFLTGGLGPTSDDITKFVLADYLEEEIIHHPPQVDRIEAYFAKTQRQVTENNYQQALTLTNAITLSNDVGLAAGLIYEKERIGKGPQIYIVLPGPPFEMNHMLTTYVKPYLVEKISDRGVIESKYINLFGIGESQVANDLDDLISQQQNPTIAVYAQPMRVTVRLTANASTTAEAQRLNDKAALEIVKRLEDYFIGYGINHSLEKFVLDLLSKRHLTLSLAESLTGGLVLESLTAIPHASDVVKGGFVTYQTETKVNFLGVSQDLIDKYTVVSAEVAKAMAEKTLIKADTDLALSLTGVAGPDYLADKSPGTVFIALAVRNQDTIVKKLDISDRPRDVVRHLSKNQALSLIRDYFEK